METLATNGSNDSTHTQPLAVPDVDKDAEIARLKDEVESLKAQLAKKPTDLTPHVTLLEIKLNEAVDHLGRIGGEIKALLPTFDPFPQQVGKEARKVCPHTGTRTAASNPISQIGRRHRIEAVPMLMLTLSHTLPRAKATDSPRLVKDLFAAAKTAGILDGFELTKLCEQQYKRDWQYLKSFPRRGMKKYMELITVNGEIGYKLLTDDLPWTPQDITLTEQEVAAYQREHQALRPSQTKNPIASSTKPVSSARAKKSASAERPVSLGNPREIIREMSQPYGIDPNVMLAVTVIDQLPVHPRYGRKGSMRRLFQALKLSGVLERYDLPSTDEAQADWAEAPPDSPFFTQGKTWISYTFNGANISFRRKSTLAPWTPSDIWLDPEEVSAFLEAYAKVKQ